MIGESISDESALSDITRINQIGVPQFMAGQSEIEEAIYRVRRAYDTAWQKVYEVGFGDEGTTETNAAPTTKIINIFDRVFDANDDPQAAACIMFAASGSWSRGETNEIEALFSNNAQYFYESKFLDKLIAVCKEGELATLCLQDEAKEQGQHSTPELTARMLVNYLTACVLSPVLIPDGTMSVDEAKLGVRIILRGAGPTPDS